MSGNPFGLAEISHFGAFQRVGGKAGGFINKKFFHPSSIRNQEKLWKAQTADESERRRQMELEKRREEERQVETLRKQMYLAGQGKAGDFLSASDGGGSSAASSIERSEQNELFDAQQRRRQLVNKEKRRLEKASGELAPSPSPEASPAASPSDEEDEADEDEFAAVPGQDGQGNRVLAKSKYAEDVHPLGHSSVWGSWFAKEGLRWGFQCCRALDRTAECPEAPTVEEAAAAAAAAVPESKRARKRRRVAENRDAGDADGVDAGDGEAAAEVAAEAAAEAPRAAATLQAPPPAASLMDNRMFEAAQRRKEQKRLEEEKKAREKEQRDSGYLANLLQDPSAGGKA